MQTTTILTSEEIDQRLTKASELIFPITDDMCIRLRTGARNNRIVFIRRMTKELQGIESDKLKKIVLDELERKATVK